MNRPWFDPETGALLLDEYVAEMPSFQKVIEDQVVTEREVTQQAERVVECLKNLEDSLPETTRSSATDALCELAVLYALERHYHVNA